jgi:hypothetical protein
MTVSDARQLKDREAGNAKLKKLLAESEFDKASPAERGQRQKLSAAYP